MTQADAEVPSFRREFLGAANSFTRIGGGALGGKASGLARVRRDVLAALAPTEFPRFDIAIPTLTVLTTELFDEFMAHNALYEVALAEGSDARIAQAFQRSELPARHVGDLRALIAGVHCPLAIRSSSLLEDDLAHPFAGVYGTKMIPNLRAEIDVRFQKLQQAIKYVYASTFFRAAKDYIQAVGQDLRREKMAVLIQEVMGSRHDRRFYPHISGVARSYNYYPSGHARCEDGVVNLALGLGKQIVDGGLCWNYAPAYPQAPPPYNDIGDQLKNSQTKFWAVSMEQPRNPDPIRETEYLVNLELADAEWDRTLTHLVSTYDPRSDRLRPGLSSDGPRLLDFAPILRMGTLPLNDLLLRLLDLAESAVGSAVEIEFALDLAGPEPKPFRFGFLQLRPMAVSAEEIAVTEEDLTGVDVLLASETVLGNGSREDIQDVVYLKPDVFEAKHTPAMVTEIDAINRALVAAGRPYLLLGFGRWGSSDPWLGVSVDWGKISGARVIVEATLPQMNPDLSQGSHFFHNLISFKVLYLSVAHSGRHRIDWDWLQQKPGESESRFARHVHLDTPLSIRVDGRQGRGVIRRRE